MKLLVVSDSHGNVDALRNILITHYDRSDMIIHLGDGEKDYESVIKHLPVPSVFVRGNCDFASSAPDLKIIEVEGKRILCTHGYRYSVKYGLSSLKSAARDQKVDMVLFGHTHNAHVEYDDGLYVVNPGSVGWRCMEPSFAFIDVVKSGILPNIVHI